MPLYEYRCLSCETRFERIQKFSDPPVDTCPTCGGKVEKLVSSPAFQFKGSGWYITDYARKGDQSSESSKKDAKTDAKTETSSTEGSTSASDSKKDAGGGKAAPAAPPAKSES